MGADNIRRRSADDEKMQLRVCSSRTLAPILIVLGARSTSVL